MFRCDNCGGVQPPKTKTEHVVVERRDVEYKDKSGSVIARGWEIVKELALCGVCRRLFA